MTEEVLWELGVIKEHVTDKDMLKPLVDGKKEWLVLLLWGELSYPGLRKSKLFLRAWT